VAAVVLGLSVVSSVAAACDGKAHSTTSSVDSATDWRTSPWADEIRQVPDRETPPAQTHHMGREISTTMHYLGAPWLVRESREREEDCTTMLRQLDIEPGQTVADLGCGNGFYTLKLARMVGPKGKVYAVDIQPQMLILLMRRAEKAGLENIVPVLGSVVDPGLPEEQIDLILLVDAYHEFSPPEEMLARMRASLKPAGRVALAEFRAEDPEVPIKPLHKMSKRQILKEWRAGGFRPVGQFDELPWQHLMFFARDDVPAEQARPADRQKYGQVDRRGDDFGATSVALWPRVATAGAPRPLGTSATRASVP
jgi:ubiquinone/menaquinone biosynthesis C-methylase UbiE